MLFEIVRLGLIHAAALIAVAALTCRDQLVLRALLVVSTLLYILYYLVVPEIMLWDALFWTVVNLGVNLLMMARLVFARTQFRLSAEERRLFAALGGLSPGEFRSLMKIGHWRRSEGNHTLLREGEAVETVYYVLDGRSHVKKAGRSLVVGPQSFIGEAGFLRRQPASATVMVEAGACYIEWPVAALNALRVRRPLIKVALDGLLASDMAAKMAAA
ncbi:MULTISPECIES: cyclic nucleotide-binding domain-containing protein [Labrys]|uniref:cyclic nucleotide-binding domain-containing protein n=1 Tax=Labrys TaxID=204476 RepID=UPI00083492C4|nr:MULTISPECIES: cyclic nucleotide-binding domain-containing protein [unclassified Labrys (in: a-proteobacteria)]MDZ5454530.1 cyclic nucleotide-binding domain-containing protein [Labrys sp. ZIDIC5]OCC04644.1 hypothetical protein BA190_13205 [Labrys sp. WJW]